MRSNRSRERLLVEVAALLSAISCASARAAEVEIAWDQDLAFAHDRDHYQRLLQDIVQKSYAQVSDELGLTLGQALQVKVDSRAHFEEQFGTAAALVEAAHYSREVIHINGGNRLDDRFAGLIVHEMTHAVLDYRGTGGRLPAWLNEGLAERLSWKRKGLYDLAPNQVSEIKRARDQGTLTPLPASGQLTELGYMRCFAAVLFLEKKIGKDKVLALVRRTLEGEPFDRVLDRELRWSVADLEREFGAWVDHLP